LTRFVPGRNTKFTYPKFHSALKDKLSNKVTYDSKLYTKDQLIFLYLNFNLQSYQLYDRILSLE
jgi:hypothetical protein